MAPTEEYVWLITGTSRGIGLEMTRQLLQSSSHIVIAACRNPSKASALQTLAGSAKGRLHILSLDVTNSETVRKSVDVVAAIVGDRGIDYLINNAGISAGRDDQAFTTDLNTLTEIFQTNVVGPASVAQSFIPFVEKSQKKTIVNISSTLGSMGADCGSLGAYYSVTKAALNMLTYKQAKERPNITAITICPGWLKTDMGTESAQYDVSFGVAGVIKVISELKPGDSGKFVNFKGEHVPW